MYEGVLYAIKFDKSTFMLGHLRARSRLPQRDLEAARTARAARPLQPAWRDDPRASSKNSSPCRRCRSDWRMTWREPARAALNAVTEARGSQASRRPTVARYLPSDKADLQLRRAANADRPGRAVHTRVIRAVVTRPATRRGDSAHFALRDARGQQQRASRPADYRLLPRWNFATAYGDRHLSFARRRMKALVGHAHSMTSRREDAARQEGGAREVVTTLECPPASFIHARATKTPHRKIGVIAVSSKRGFWVRSIPTRACAHARASRK